MKRKMVDHVAVAALCRANPRQWQDVGEYGSGQSADAVVHAIRNAFAKSGRSAYAPPGAFEARRELTEYGARVEARYVGEAIRDVATAVREYGALPVPAGNKPTLTFFRPGRLYTRDLPFRASEDRPNFECVGIGRHPTKDSLRAFGFEQPGDGQPWASAAQRMEEWTDGWVDLGPARPDRLTHTFAPTQALREEEPLAPQTERSRAAEQEEKCSREADATPFFVSGHLYANGPWRFHCGTVTTHPATGERTALGWLQVDGSGWTTYGYSEAEWGSDWTDVTGPGEGQ
ncbi:hypothetical protein [Streptomyces sp. NPDC057877]|uniref:hypothetical protein n=1 Tax=Streptomyces sp. NPDC057877 TaxID=3346269 RepID=UPI0036BF75D0